MKHDSTGSLLSTVFVDYDNVYLSLKRKNAEAAKRFAKNASTWIAAIASGELMTPTNGIPLSTPRRIVMNRCYGNPVPRRNSNDNATDMNSFPFVRHHYLRAGFEVIDCPPLTAQLKNSADIRMVMDVRDYLIHDTYFDEFIILSGDADFTPVLHRLRAHARRTVIYANDYTAAPYRAISDGEIREADLIARLMDGDLKSDIDPDAAQHQGLPSAELLTQTRTAILNEVLSAVRGSQQPILLEALADRAVRVLGHDKTVGTAWGGVGSFRDLLLGGLPKSVKLSNEAPYYVYETPEQAASDRQTAAFEPQQPSAGCSIEQEPTAEALPPAKAAPQLLASQVVRQQQPLAQQSHGEVQGASNTGPGAQADASRASIRDILPPAFVDGDGAQARSNHAQSPATAQREASPTGTAQASPQRSASRQATSSDNAEAIQHSIARIHEACQAPPLSPPEYRVLFQVMADEIKTNGLTGARTLVNIVQAAQEYGVNLRRDDARFILEIVSEADPWFEQGASSHLFASRFRNFVVARCRGQGMALTADELDLIEAWFSGANQGSAQQGPNGGPSNGQPHETFSTSQAQPPRPRAQSHQQMASPQDNNAPPLSARHTSEEGGQPNLGDVIPQRPPQNRGHDPFGGGQQAQADDDLATEDFPRIVRTRARG